jgi:hypothetical protein
MGGSTVVINSGNRTFQSDPRGFMFPPGHALTVGDFDGDSHADIFQGMESTIVLIFGNGDATFDDPITSSIRHDLELIGAHRFRSADLDRDGRSDLGVIGDEFVLIYMGCHLERGKGLPDDATVALTLTGNGRFMEFADMNSDDLLDVVAQTDHRGKALVQVFYGQSNGVCDVSFEDGEPFRSEVDGRPAVLAVGDVDGDLAPDVVLTAEGDGRAQVFLNDGNCRVAEPGDSNADGRIDLSDAITTLGYLFLGGQIPCLGAAEVSGDGRVDISDPIYLLQYLFASGPAIPDTGAVNCSAK